ncbi:MAG TPA: PilZ domain-containing protein [Nitrospirae bacterium]|nr:PilZ domain-containing protein [Nitrospirota bacterium]
MRENLTNKPLVVQEEGDSMDINRVYERMIVNLEAEVLAGGHTYKGTIENISIDGLYIQFITGPTKSSKDFLPISRVKIRFQLPSGEKVDLICEIRWINIYAEPPDSVVNHLGIQIIDSPKGLKDFVDTLQMPSE